MSCYTHKIAIVLWPYTLQRHFTSLHCIVGAQKQIEMIGTESSHAKAAGLSALNRCYNCLHVRMREQVPTAGGRNIIIAYSVDA